MRWTSGCKKLTYPLNPRPTQWGEGRVFRDQNLSEGFAVSAQPVTPPSPRKSGARVLQSQIYRRSERASSEGPLRLRACWGW